MEGKRCIHEVLKKDGSNKDCTNGEEMKCKNCHIAHPEVLDPISKYPKNEPPIIVMESNPFED